MTILKKILFPIFSLLLLWQTAVILQQVMASAPAGFNPRETFFAAFLIALYCTGIFAFTGFAYATSNILPAAYYQIKNPNRLKQVYRLLGVKYFRVLLLVFFWGHKKNARKFFNGTRSGLQNFVYQSKQSEFGHMAAFVFIAMLTPVLLVKGYFLLSLMLMAINVPGNLYPVLLQRYHRIRINHVIQAGQTNPV